MLILFQIFHIGYHRILSRIPCAIQGRSMLIINSSVLCSSKLLTYPLQHFCGNHRIVFHLCKSASLLLFCKYVHLYHFTKLDSTCNIIFVFV